MRVTTNMMFSQSITGMTTNNNKVYKALQEAASGVRVNVPSDDPVASSLALGVKHSQTINTEFLNNQKDASSSLKTLETQLNAVRDGLHLIRTHLLEVGDGAYNESDMKTISFAVRETMDELLGLANATDNQGNFLFSGFQTSVRPFVQLSDKVQYYGDQGQRVLQVGQNRYMPTTYDGANIFMNVPSGDGYMTTIANTSNRGTGVISQDSVNNPARWESSSKNFTIRFAMDTTNMAPEGPVMKYDIIDNVTGNSILSGQPSVGTPDNPGDYWRTYEPGDTILFQSQDGEPEFDYGFSVSMKGNPTAYLDDEGYHFDEFTIQEAKSQSIFTTLQDVVAALESAPPTQSDPTPWDPNPMPNGNTSYMNAITQALHNIDNAMDNVLRVQTEVGSHLVELEALANNSQDMNLIYEDNVSNYLDADYQQSISDFMKYKVCLEAVQKTFAQVQQMSLFNYI